MLRLAEVYFRMLSLVSTNRPKVNVRQTLIGGPFSVTNTRNGDSLLGRLTQSIQDLHYYVSTTAFITPWFIFSAHSSTWLVYCNTYACCAN